MAAPTNVRVEATSPATTQLNWTNNEANAIKVHRSTDGAAFSIVATLPLNTVAYQNTGLNSSTKYWYKLSYDGVTFSLTVTVITHTCPSPQGSQSEFNLPRFSVADQQSDELNNLAERIESLLAGRVLTPDECPVCPTDGAIVIDCTKNCDTFVVLVDQNINSISIISCDVQGSGSIEFVVPTGTRQICGWPGGLSFTGDECFQAPITGPRTVSVGFGGGKLKPSTARSRVGYGGGGGGVGGGG